MVGASLGSCASGDKMRSKALDGLRGVAATAVVFFHAILHNDWPALEPVLIRPIQAAASRHDLVAKVLLSVFNGWAAVTVFFVLSGCVLRVSLDRRAGEAIAPTAMGFTLARLIRLYPPVIACMILFYLLGAIGIPGYPQFTFEQMLVNAVLWAAPMHGASETVQAEVIAVPFILAAWMLCRWLGSAAIAFCMAYALLAVTGPGMVFHLPNMNAWLLPFIAGMAVADPKLRPLFAGAPPLIWFGAAIAMLACRPFFNATLLMPMVASTLCAAMLVGGLLYGQPGSLHRMLERPTLQFLGRISFSLYLLNVPMLRLVWSVSDRMAWPHDKPLLAGLLIGALSLALTIPLAIVSERWIERPATAIGHAVAAAMRRKEPVRSEEPTL